MVKWKIRFSFRTMAAFTSPKPPCDNLSLWTGVTRNTIASLMFWKLPHTPTAHTLSYIFWHADFTVFSRYPQGTQEWFGDTTHSLTPKNTPEHRAHVVWNISEAQVERLTERKVTSVFRVKFFLEEHGINRSQRYPPCRKRGINGGVLKISASLMIF